MRSPHEVIVQPHITERSVTLSYGDSRVQREEELVRKYTFVVAKDASKIEIKNAVEAIYNAGKKKKDSLIEVTSVRTIRMVGKKRRVGQKSTGYRPDRKKAIVTLAKGQMIEDFGV
ncbi:MAG: 50S ribosomal protein L23 [Fimbriimonadaceae bacterium]